MKKELPSLLFLRPVCLDHSWFLKLRETYNIDDLSREIDVAIALDTLCMLFTSRSLETERRSCSYLSYCTRGLADYYSYCYTIRREWMPEYLMVPVLLVFKHNTTPY